MKTFKILKTDQPFYLHSILSMSVRNRTLRSNQGTLLVEPRVRQSQGNEVSAFVPLVSETPFLCHCACRPQFRVLSRNRKPIYLVSPILHIKMFGHPAAFSPFNCNHHWTFDLWIMLNAWNGKRPSAPLCWGDWRYRSNIIIYLFLRIRWNLKIRSPRYPDHPKNMIQKYPYPFKGIDSIRIAITSNFDFTTASFSPREAQNSGWWHPADGWLVWRLPAWRIDSLFVAGGFGLYVNKWRNPYEAVPLYWTTVYCSRCSEL